MSDARSIPTSSAAGAPPERLPYLKVADTDYRALDYAALLGGAVDTLPYALRVVAENAARHSEGGSAVAHVAARAGAAVPFRPARLLMQDMLGLALLVDMMAMRSKLEAEGGDPGVVDMSLPVDLVIDHSMTINFWAEKLALQKNMAREFEVNRERFAFLKACEARFPNLRVVPPGGGIMHQVNLEFLGRTVMPAGADATLLIPDTNLGTDSHTTMINGLGVLGWGIGGLEAEAIMFGEATALNVPKVVGLELTGVPSHDITATDIALVVAEKLRTHGVVDKFVELFGPGYAALGVPDRALVANMSPEYGSTCVYCPVDAQTIRYLRETGRSDEAHRAEAYCRTQKMWSGDAGAGIAFDEVVTLDLGAIGRSVSGPARPEQRIDLNEAPSRLARSDEKEAPRRVPVAGQAADIGDGDVIIASITSCTNTANPRNMVIAGLLARNAVRRGLRSKPFVKTSLIPGSRVVAQYLASSGLQDALDALGFHVTAFSCGTCNGMSGPLQPGYEEAIVAHDIKGVAVLSGNRNFAGRIHPLSSRNVLASPPLVVAYALSGTILKDITTDPLGTDEAGSPVYLSDLWPSAEEVDAIIGQHLAPENYVETYRTVGTSSAAWNALDVESGRYDWAPSTYVTFPPFVATIERDPAPLLPLKDLRPLVILGDSVTTDHISPSGMITPASEAGQYLSAQGVAAEDFNSFGTRRGSSDVVIRSTFANYRLRNEMVPGKEGSWTRIQPGGTEATVYQAIAAYRARGQGLLVIGGRDYGCGSSRDTAAKASWLAGIRAVLAESFERIHRSNLVNMGIAPLCFPEGVTRKTLGLDGSETYDIVFADDLSGATMTVRRADGRSDVVDLDLRLYNEAERNTFRHGGLLPRFFRSFMEEAA